MTLIRRLFLLGSLALLPTVAWAQTFPVLAPLPGTGTLGAPVDASSFTFVVAGDNRPAKSGDPQPATLTAIVKAVQGMTGGTAGAGAPAFVLWSGDTISGKKPGDKKKMKKEYEEFLGIVRSAGIPSFAAPGNHELNGKPKAQSCPKAIDLPDPSGKLLKYWESSMGAPFGVFRYGNSAFLSLNTDDTVGPGVTIPPCEYNGYVGPGQRAALSATLAALAADKSVAHIFVFMHRPLYASPVNPGGQLADASRDPLKAILDDMAAVPNLSVVFASHQHLFYFHDKEKPYQTGPFHRTDPAGVKPAYIVSGGAGAPLTKKATPATGGYHNYLLVQVKGADVTITVNQVP
jgi:hypothetical protein